MSQQMSIEYYDSEPQPLARQIRDVTRQYYGAQQVRSEPIGSPKKAVEFLREEIAIRRTERFYLITLNTSHVIEHVIEMSRGHLNATVVSPREVFRAAIMHEAAAIMVAHNHPSGNLQPGKDDIALTRKIKDAGDIIGIPLRDHFILTEDDHISFVQSGLL